MPLVPAVPLSGRRHVSPLILLVLLLPALPAVVVLGQLPVAQQQQQQQQEQPGGGIGMGTALARGDGAAITAGLVDTPAETSLSERLVMSSAGQCTFDLSTEGADAHAVPPAGLGSANVMAGFSGPEQIGDGPTAMSAPVPAGSHHYDLTGLRLPNAEFGGRRMGEYVKDLNVGPSIEFTYRLNLCANTQTPCLNEAAPATETLRIPAGETCRVLGRLSDGTGQAKTAAVYELVPTRQTDQGRNPSGADLLLTYHGGDICDPASGSTRSVSIQMVCDLTMQAQQTR